LLLPKSANKSTGSGSSKSKVELPTAKKVVKSTKGKVEKEMDKEEDDDDKDEAKEHSNEEKDDKDDKEEKDEVSFNVP